MGYRRRASSFILATAALLVSAALVALLRPAAPVSPLCAGCNVLLISMDTLRADHVGAYGYPRPTTPNLDALARRGILFEDAISQSAWTRPAHASMFTGLYPSEHGIVGMAGRPKLAHELPTLARVLADRGYDTAAFTGGANMSAHFGFDNGFALYRSPGRRLEDSLAPAAAWLATARRPFFLFVHGLDSHRPFRSLPVDRRALGLPAQMPKGLSRACRDEGVAADLAPFVAEYDAAIHRGDRSIGLLLDMLGGLGLAETTVVIVTSDHGEEFLEHGRCFHIRTLYREIVRVPLIFSVPRLAARRVAGVVPASVSVAPTILDLVGVGADALAGPSLARALEGGDVAGRYVVSETSSRYAAGHGHGHVRALTGDRDKLVDWISRDRLEYYDLLSDPLEQRPLPASGHAERLVERLARFAKAHPQRVPAAVAGPLSPQLARELRALGYVD